MLSVKMKRNLNENDSVQNAKLNKLKMKQQYNHIYKFRFSTNSFHFRHFVCLVEMPVSMHSRTSSAIITNFETFIFLRTKTKIVFRFFFSSSDGDDGHKRTDGIQCVGRHTLL